MYAVDFTQASIVFGIRGETLTADEEALFRDANPAGYILFSRNLATPSQVKKLTERLRELTENNEVLIMIDQEGAGPTIASTALERIPPDVSFW